MSKKNKKENKAVIVGHEKLQPVAETTPAQHPILAAALDPNIDIEKMERLFAIHREHEAEESRKAFVVAMAAFNSEGVTITKDKKAGFDHKGGGGRTEYAYATLANVAGTINAGLGRHGLSATWKLEQNGKIKVTCTVTHSQGHSESTALEAEADNSGRKNSIQAVGSTISYLERYTLLALTGRAAHEMDDDGAKHAQEEIEFIGPDHVISLQDLIKEVDADLPKFLAYMSKYERRNIMTLDDISLKAYDTAVAALEVKRGAE